MLFTDTPRHTPLAIPAEAPLPKPVLVALVKEETYRAWQRMLNSAGGSVVSSAPDFRGHIRAYYVEG